MSKAVSKNVRFIKTPPLPGRGKFEEKTVNKNTLVTR